MPLYGVEGRFERINQHPVMFQKYLIYLYKKFPLIWIHIISDWLQNAGTHSFSIGVTEVINTNLLIELSADDVDYVYQRLVFPNWVSCLPLSSFLQYIDYDYQYCLKRLWKPVHV